jgi:hypothetical protein
MSGKLESLMSKIVKAVVFMGFILTITAVVSGCGKRVIKVTRSEIIPNHVVRQDDPDLLEGKEVIVKKGTPGVKQIVYKEEYSSGKLVSRKKVSQKVIYRPVDELIKVGTKKAVEFKLIAQGKDFTFTLLSASRAPQYQDGKKIVRGDILIIEGKLSNNTDGSVKSGNYLDLAAIHPNLRGGLVFLKAQVPPEISARQKVDITWYGNLLTTSKQKIASPAIDIKQIQTIPRPFVGPKNALSANPKSLEAISQ